MTGFTLMVDLDMMSYRKGIISTLSKIDRFVIKLYIYYNQIENLLTSYVGNSTL